MVLLFWPISSSYCIIIPYFYWYYSSTFRTYLHLDRNSLALDFYYNQLFWLFCDSAFSVFLICWCCNILFSFLTLPNVGLFLLFFCIYIFQLFRPTGSCFFLFLVLIRYVRNFCLSVLSQSYRQKYQLFPVSLLRYKKKKKEKLKVKSKDKKLLMGTLALSVFSVLQKCWRSWTSNAERKSLQTWKLLLKAKSLKSTKMF